MEQYKTDYTRDKPYSCILCNSTTNSFTTIEHIVPHSLGNNFLTLGKGWVCDNCNNICSNFESKAINHTLLGHERVLLGVITKKGKPAKSYVNKTYWYTEKGAQKNTFYVDKKGLHKNPFLKYAIDNNAKAFIQLYHNKYDTEIAKLLLKIAIEFMSVGKFPQAENLKEAKEYILNLDQRLWPYVLIQNKNPEKDLLSVFSQLSIYMYSHALASNFDLFFYTIDDDAIMYFKYGRYLFAINLSSRDIKWLDSLKENGTRYVASPIDFAYLSHS